MKPSLEYSSDSCARTGLLGTCHSIPSTRVDTWTALCLQLSKTLSEHNNSSTWRQEKGLVEARQVAHACNFNTQRQRQEDFEFKNSDFWICQACGTPELTAAVLDCVRPKPDQASQHSNMDGRGAHKALPLAEELRAGFYQNVSQFSLRVWPGQVSSTLVLGQHKKKKKSHEVGVGRVNLGKVRGRYCQHTLCIHMEILKSGVAVHTPLITALGEETNWISLSRRVVVAT